MTAKGVRWRARSANVMSAGLGVCVILMAWFGFQAIREWEHSSTMLAEQRTNNAADLVAIAFSRDMRGAQNSVLLSWHVNAATLEPSYEMDRLLASAFARYPYPESFFGWRGEPSRSSIIFFNRVDRLPEWTSTPAGSAPFPVVITREPAIAEELASRLLDDTKHGAELSTFEMRLGGAPYQVVAHELYQDAFREHPIGGLGFTVNLSWVRRHYFPDLAGQVARVSGIHDGFALSILDETGASVMTTRPISDGTPSSRRTFPLLFADPLLVGLDRPPDLPERHWIVQVQGGDAPPPFGPYNGAGTLMLIVAAFTASMLTLALAMTARAARASAQLAEIRSDFVATMTHELKTPLATIRAIGESITSGRITKSDTVQEYAQLVVQESKRLTRLVDNSLAYARVTDVADAYHFEPLDLQLVLEDSLQGFTSQLAAQGFQVDLDVPGHLAPVNGDRVALGLLFDNVIDNAVRYSGEVRCLSVGAHEGDREITVAISDKGIGIPADELTQVTRKFFRGRHARSGGSGLGLAIVDRVLEVHRGTMVIESRVGAGTTVSVTLPTTTQDHEDTHPDR